MAKITLSLPDELFSTLELRRATTKQTRSQFFRRALEAQLRRDDEDALAAVYRRGYETLPETADEVEVARATSAGALSQEPWE